MFRWLIAAPLAIFILWNLVACVREPLGGRTLVRAMLAATAWQIISYSGLQMYASRVGAILVIAQPPRAKTSFAPTEKRSHVSENRYMLCSARVDPL